MCIYTFICYTWMCVKGYICIYTILMYIYICVYMYVCVYAWVNICVYKWFIYIYIYIYKSVCVCVCVWHIPFFEGIYPEDGIVSAKIRPCLRRNKKQIIKVYCYHWSSFTNNDRSNKYMITMRNKSHTLQETSERHTSNDEYENFISTAEFILTKPRTKCRVPRESIAVREKRKIDK